MLATNIADGTGTNSKAKVTQRGELIIAPIAYSTPYFNEMTAINTAYNFIKPKSGYEIVITSIIVNANKGVSSTDGALIEVFTASDVDSTTSVDDILTVQLIKNARQSLTGLNIKVSSGVWINAVTDDATVFLTIAGFYLKEIT